MKRERSLSRLAGERFDLLVLGCGVTGAAVARAAARGGLSVALIDQGDFGGATSANSLKIIHGGLRYLQYADLRQVRDAVSARREFFRAFPGLVAPLPCLMPTHGRGARGRLAMRAALALNDLLSRDRNAGVPPARHLPRGRLLSREETLRAVPGLAVPGLSGSALWHDGLALDSERIVLELALDAAAHGAAAANYVRAAGFLRQDGAVCGVQARDTLSGGELEIRARLVCNAAGPWFDAVNRPVGERGRELPLAKAVNILVGRPLLGEHAVGLAGGGEYRDERRLVRQGRRLYFFVPWRGGTMIGTLYLPHAGAPDSCAVEAAEIEFLVEEINRIHPTARLTPEEVRFAHVGLLPVAAAPAQSPVEARLLRRTVVCDGERDLGVAGLIGVRSVKYTAALLVAEQVVALAAAKLAATLRPAPPDAGAAPPPAAPADVPAELAARLAAERGPGAAPLFDLITADPRLARTVAQGQPTTAAEVLHAVREEMAASLADVVLRRTPLGTAGHPGREALRAAADVAGNELGWDALRRASEIARVEAEYRRLLGGAAP